MKPLELTVYPIWDAGDGTHYADHPDRLWPTNVGYEVYRKRLTDSELAAEFWASHGEANAAMTGNRRLLFSRRATLARFATLPHHDEAAQ